ncbi:hypothetical protein F9278_18255 [Streptomyces phaeolivaceus]|uniref:Integral membrane protein n=1 Tax=Streptomyces phaeolivaceus TaxID=2653200 RepID=A0A5P8K494_9ACTN|nr:hypothetical protein [Streptomyces phaeolivaceus]QFQ97846.1 hypothetical protein F9278_18255 [Streptomyces phaeolivaceus]
MPQTVQTGPASGHRPTTGSGATALRGGRTWLTRRPTPYLVVGGLFWLMMTLAYWRVPLCCDAGLYAAAVERLRPDLLDPAHPTVDLPGAGSPVYTPYAVAQGVLARLTGLGGWSLLKLAGPVNLLVLLTGIGRLVRLLTPRPWAPVLALPLVTLLWGTGRAPWSGGPGLMPMTTDLGHPSTLAVALTFWAWAWTGARARGGGLSGRRVRYVGPGGLGSVWAYAGLGMPYGLILAVHPVTGVGAAAGALAAVTASQRGWRWPLAGRWALTGAVALLIAVSWPYYDVLSSAAGGTGPEEVRPHRYADLAGHLWPALLGLPALPALWARGRGSARDPLVPMFVAECLVVVYGRVGGHPAYDRIAGLAAVLALVALAVELTTPRPWRWARRLLGGAAVAGACAGLLTVQAGAVVPAALDPVGFERPPRWPSYAWAARHLRAGDVVIADGYVAGRTIAGYGVNLVAPARPDPAVEEAERARRLADVRAYLDPASTRERRGIVARRYGVGWLLLTRRREVPEEAVVVDWGRETGEVLARIAPRQGVSAKSRRRP